MDDIARDDLPIGVFSIAGLHHVIDERADFDHISA
jgi:hypothetical protein